MSHPEKITRRAFAVEASVVGLSVLLGWQGVDFLFGPKDDALASAENEKLINANFGEKKVFTEIENGAQLLDALGLKSRVVYLLYGRPTKAGEDTWGSLNCRTAEEAWQKMQSQQKQIKSVLGQSDFALSVLNPVYRSDNGVLADVYVQKALELAPANQGLVALSFNSLIDAQATLQRLATIIPAAALARLSVSLDVEHFPTGQSNAVELNAFTTWFADWHEKWAGKTNLPGFVFLYTFNGPNGLGRIQSLAKLTQYYLAKKTLVVPIYDGSGGKELKLMGVGSLVSNLPNSPDYPALAGVMEFASLWGKAFDQVTIGETFSLLQGAPVAFLASQ